MVCGEFYLGPERSQVRSGGAVMIQAKICMLGSTAVGKTSLVSRFVRSMFSEKYHTSIGVKVDSKVMNCAGIDLMLMLWDLQGDDELQRIRHSYLRGSAGLFFVADGTRKETLWTVRRLSQEIGLSSSVPALLALNKADMTQAWEITDADLDVFAGIGWNVVRTSAKTGDGVESAFVCLGNQIAKNRAGVRT